MDEYIRCISDRPHSIFHLPTLRASARANDLPAGLRPALLSYGARFHPDPEVSCLGTYFFEDAKRHLHLDLEHVCLENVQTYILLAGLSAASMRPSSEALYLSIGIHMAETLQLGVRRTTDGPELEEIKRRVWCSLFMADYWCSTGNEIGRKMAGVGSITDLPVDEASFHGLAAPVAASNGTRSLGLWAYMITLVDLFGQIQDLNLRSVQEGFDKRLLDGQVDALGHALDSWERGLPEHVRCTVPNLHAFRAKQLGGPLSPFTRGSTTPQSCCITSTWTSTGT